MAAKNTDISPQYERPERQYVALDLLIPNERNYNQHPPQQIHELKESLKRYGQIKPSVARINAGGTYTLLAGHGIIEAAKELLTEHPDTFQHLKQWDVVVVPATWNALDYSAYMVSDNETSRKAEIDETVLAQLLEEQQNAGFDLAALGSDEQTLRQMLQSLGDEYLANDEGKESPDEFKSYDEDIETEYRCPKCSYCWSGKPK